MSGKGDMKAREINTIKKDRKGETKGRKANGRKGGQGKARRETYRKINKEEE